MVDLEINRAVFGSPFADGVHLRNDDLVDVQKVLAVPPVDSMVSLTMVSSSMSREMVIGVAAVLVLKRSLSVGFTASERLIMLALQFATATANLASQNVNFPLPGDPTVQFSSPHPPLPL